MKPKVDRALIQIYSPNFVVNSNFKGSLFLTYRRSSPYDSYFPLLMFGYFPVGVIVFCCYVMVEKNRNDKVFSSSFIASIFKTIRSASKQEQLLYGERQCFDRALFSF